MLTTKKLESQHISTPNTCSCPRTNMIISLNYDFALSTKYSARRSEAADLVVPDPARTGGGVDSAFDVVQGLHPLEQSRIAAANKK
mmetsp:Transcript_49233/g.96307  ORF Transcript_49233/g.96307 Transcript_49233/m.96307 type:complete len:86 (-) Transcript_49233:604-861(-)